MGTEAMMKMLSGKGWINDVHKYLESSLNDVSCYSGSGSYASYNGLGVSASSSKAYHEEYEQGKVAVEVLEEGQVADDMEMFLVAVRTNNKAMLLLISKWESEDDETKNYFARMAKRELEREI
jgi:hypothetical protein